MHENVAHKGVYTYTKHNTKQNSPATDENNIKTNIINSNYKRELKPRNRNAPFNVNIKKLTKDIVSLLKDSHSAEIATDK